MSENLIEARDLVKRFPIRKGAVFQREVGAVQAVSGVSFDVARGETLGLVGESGCGKSTTARLITRLLEPTSGSVLYRGEEIAGRSRRELIPLRREMQMIFQDPYSSLNPRKTVGSIIGEPFEIHRVERDERRRRALVRDLMEQVGLNPEHYNRYPHEFSGGQRQRIGVARAIALKPKLIVADEPVSALDVSIQAQILNLLRELQRDLGLTIVFIAHDLSVVRHMCDRIAVMYLGKIVEIASADALYAHPRHPYTGALLRAVPVPDPRLATVGARILGGDVPSPAHPPSGCRFHPRCPKRQDVCGVEEPPLEPKEGGNVAACHFPLQAGEIADLPTVHSVPGVPPRGHGEADVYWLLVLVTVLGPMAIGAYVVVAGTTGPAPDRPRPAWLVGWAYCVIPACYLSFQGLCEHMSGTCPSDAALSDAARARVALAALVVAILVLGVSRAVRSLRGSAAVAVVFAVLVAFAEVWMFLRLRDAGLGFAGALCLAALAWGVVAEITGVRARRAAAAP